MADLTEADIDVSIAAAFGRTPGLVAQSTETVQAPGSDEASRLSSAADVTVAEAFGRLTAVQAEAERARLRDKTASVTEAGALPPSSAVRRVEIREVALWTPRPTSGG